MSKWKHSLNSMWMKKWRTFMRLECNFELSDTQLIDFENAFQESVASQYKMKWIIHLASEKLKMAVFVSKFDHCLYDFLSRYKSGELNIEIISNQEKLPSVVESFAISFHYTSLTGRRKMSVEATQTRLLARLVIMSPMNWTSDQL